MIARALLLLALAGPAAARDNRLVPALGFAWLEQGSAGGLTQASGVTLDLRAEGRTDYPRLGYSLTVGWGLTDWDRAREWIDAGNRAGRWTTDSFAGVEAWVRNGRNDDTQALRFLGAVFADLFLALTYVAVPACYVGSVGGATSHFEVDLTGSVHLSDGPGDAWIEAGGGAVAFAERSPAQDAPFASWHGALGPVVGLGARVGALQLGARVVISPPALNSSSYGSRMIVGAVTVGLVR